MPAKKSFTLIEWLVVIAIIAILAGMLLPALNKSRESAKNVQCLNQLKQLNMATQMYLHDNKEIFFSSAQVPPGSKRSQSWAVLLFKLLRYKTRPKWAMKGDKFLKQYKIDSPHWQHMSFTYERPNKADKNEAQMLMISPGQNSQIDLDDLFPAGGR